MQEFSVSVDVGALVQVGALVRQAVFGNLAHAVAQTVVAGQARWQAAAHVAPLRQGENDAYAASVKTRQLGELAWEIYSDYKRVEEIESGTPAFDMHRYLDTSLKVRINKKGQRYLIIPMRHNTPGQTALAPAMPAAVYREAKELAASQITGRGSRRSGTGAYDMATRKPIRVAARKYLWGGRLEAGLAPKLKPEHHSDPYAGMVRFKVATGGSKFLTFRTMTEGSGGWIQPARPGLWIARAVADSLQASAAEDWGRAMAIDLVPMPA